MSGIATSAGPVAFNAALAVTELKNLCHQASYDAGWWGLEGKPDYFRIDVRAETRFGKALAAEKLALIHSEVSEALEGLRKGKADEHLPEFPSEAVELADALIRIFDYAGARRLPLGDAFVAKMAYNTVRPDHKPEARAAVGGKAF